MKKGLVVRWSERGHERSRAALWNLCIGKEAENYPPVDEIVLIVNVMADHRRFQTSFVPVRRLRAIEPRASLFHHFSLAENTNRGEAPINFQLYTHHDRNSTLLFPLVTRRCTWRTISFLHRRKEGGGARERERENPSIQRKKRRLSSALPYLVSLTFILCHATLPSFYLSWRRNRCISRQRYCVYGADG